MDRRFDYAKLSPELYTAMVTLDRQLYQSTLPAGLIHLVKLRASQMNACAFCIDMHWKDLRALGEPEHRLYSLDAWRESPFYDARERAALAWTEALTDVARTQAPDSDYEAVRAQFSESEVSSLTWTVAVINLWNRVGVGSRAQPGKYVSRLGPPEGGPHQHVSASA